MSDRSLTDIWFILEVDSRLGNSKRRVIQGKKAVAKALENFTKKEQYALAPYLPDEQTQRHSDVTRIREWLENGKERGLELFCAVVHLCADPEPCKP